MSARRVYRLAWIGMLALLLALGESAAEFWLRCHTPQPPDSTPALPPLSPREPDAPPHPSWHPRPGDPVGREVPPGYGQADLVSTNQFRVRINLDGDAKPGDAELAKKVQRVLLQAKPQNPGRAASFPRWESVELPGEKGPYRIKVVPLGWVMFITRVMQLPHDNWRAVVRVHPIARTVDYRTCSIGSHHIEYYRYLNGQLELFNEAVNPVFRDPSDDGLMMIVRH
ncbi:MAG: hypothetical protein ACP5XB_07355 [Isosphaeraceae bacterium]